MEINAKNICFLLSILTFATLKAVARTQNTTHIESLAITDVKQDFDAVINETGPLISTMLLFRYPNLLQIITKIVNDKSWNNSSSLSEYELCQSVKENLQKSKDECKKFSSSLKKAAVFEKT